MISRSTGRYPSPMHCSRRWSSSAPAQRTMCSENLVFPSIDQICARGHAAGLGICTKQIVLPLDAASDLPALIASSGCSPIRRCVGQRLASSSYMQSSSYPSGAAIPTVSRHQPILATGDLKCLTTVPYSAATLPPAMGRKYPSGVQTTGPSPLEVFFHSAGIVLPLASAAVDGSVLLGSAGGCADGGRVITVRRPPSAQATRKLYDSSQNRVGVDISR